MNRTPTVSKDVESQTDLLPRLAALPFSRHNAENIFEVDDAKLAGSAYPFSTADL